jgi:hypothetical protein
MPPIVGTLDISTLLAARFQSVVEYGMDTIVEVLQRDLAIHNQLMTEMIASLCDPTTDRQRRYGTSAVGEMVEVDEYGRGPSQVVRPGATVGFPLKLFQYTLGWTYKWMQTHTPADMAIQVVSAENAHARKVRLEIQKAFYLSSNYTFNDHLVDKVDLAVKRLTNADGAAIPDGPNGEVFDGATHTHYTANAGLVVANISAIVQTVVEHGHGGAVRLAINRTNEAAFRALTGFTPYQDPRLIFPSLPASSGTTANLTGRSLDITRLDNRAIGILDAAEVWVKPWALAGYALAYDQASTPPLAFRQRNTEALQGLRIAAMIDDYPLVAEFMEAEFGIGAWERTNGAVHDFVNASYTDPSL